jgi:hypothetical protein
MTKHYKVTVPLLPLVLSALLPLLLAQQTLNNDSVIKMVKMGFPEDMIVNTINRSPATYDTTVDGMNALRSAGVGNKAISAMVVKGTPPPPTAPIQAAPSKDVPPIAASTPLAPPSAAPTTPPAAQQPPRAAYMPSPSRPRVFLQAQSHGSLWNATRDQSMEMSKDFERKLSRCQNFDQSTDG